MRIFLPRLAVLLPVRNASCLSLNSPTRLPAMADQAPPPQDPGYPQPGYPPQQQPAYPPQQAGYPPQQQAGYPPQQYPPQQQAGYPPQQYPPQQQAGYPPQQYPPQEQAGYPPQQQPGYLQTDAPPPYKQPDYPPQTSQQSSTNVVVVQQQPTVTTTVYTRHYGSGDHGLVYAIIASCIVFWCFGWIGLFCTIPAIFIAINAQSAEASGDLTTMRSQQNLSYGLSTAGLITGFVCLFIYIVAGAAS